MNTILLLFGGKSSEYEVSLSSATGAYRNLDREKYNVLLGGITREGRFWLYEDDPAKMEYTYNIFSRNDTAMTLKHDRSNTLYRLVRAGEDADE